MKAPPIDREDWALITQRYRYVPSVQRWMLQQNPSQKLFAVGMEEEEIRELFPAYRGDIPYSRAVLVTTETISLERRNAVDEWVDHTCFIYEGEAIWSQAVYTPQDILVVTVDHVRGPYLYYYYLDLYGEEHRQWILDQHRDGNNGGISSYYLNPTDEVYQLSDEHYEDYLERTRQDHNA